MSLRGEPGKTRAGRALLPLGLVLLVLALLALLSTGCRAPSEEETARALGHEGGADTGASEAAQNAAEHATTLAMLEQPRLSADASAEEAGYGEFAAEHGRLSLGELRLEQAVPGISIAVFRNFEIVFTHQWGVADLETGQPVTADTLFQAASISKPVGAAAVVALADAGVLSLDDEVNGALERFTLPENEHTKTTKVTFRHLLSHTGGITVRDFPGYSPDADIPSAVALLEGLAPANSEPVRVAAVPGTIERYSGGGSTLVQVAVEDVTGKAFAEVVRERVLEPTGMASSGFFQPPTGEWLERAARAHHRSGTNNGDADGAELVPIETEASHPLAIRAQAPFHVYPELLAAGLWTTPTDLSRFAIAVGKALRGDHAEQHFLSTDGARQMTTPVPPSTHAIGFQMQNRGTEEEPVWYFSHSGGNWGFRCYLVAHTENGDGAVVMINGTDFNLILELFKRIASTFEWQGTFTKLPINWGHLLL